MNFVRLSIAELGAGTGQTDRQTVRALHNAPPLGGLHMKKMLSIERILSRNFASSCFDL